MLSAIASPTSAGEPQLVARPGSVPFIIAAPHGHFDRGTGDIVRQVCAFSRWNCLIAARFRSKKTPLNVNRPTERIGVSPKNELHTSRAAKVYARYLNAWHQLGGNAAKVYVEVHGNSRERSALHLDVATVGWSKRDLHAVKRILSDGLKSNGLGTLDVVVEGIDRIYFRARSTKRWGILGRVDKGLHLEFPRHVRKAAKRRFVVQFLLQVLPELEVLAAR